MNPALLSEIRQHRNNRALVAPHAAPNRSIHATSRAINVARQVTQAAGGNPNLALHAPLVNVAAQRRLRHRPGPAGPFGPSVTLSSQGHSGVAYSVPTGYGGGVAYMTQFLQRSTAAVQRLRQTNVGRTMLQGLDHYTNTHVPQLGGHAAMTIAPVQHAALGLGSAAQGTNIHPVGRHGSTIVNWDMNEQIHAGWNQLTNDAVLLGHESVHALRRTRAENAFSNPAVATPGNVQRTEEIQTTGLARTPSPVNENQLRGALGVRPRFNYGGLPAPTTTLGYLADNRVTRAVFAGANWVSGWWQG